MDSKTKNCFAILGVVTLSSLLSLNGYIAYNLAIGRNVVLQKTVSVMLTEDEERQGRQDIVDKRYSANKPAK